MLNRLRNKIITTSKRAYHPVIVEHFNNPKNVGKFDKEDPNVGTGLVGAPACGDVVRLQIKVDENDKIIDSKIKVFGCLAGNSPISTPEGYRDIKDLKIGDEVWSWNGEQIIRNNIENIFTYFVPKEDLIKLTFEGSSYFKFICTKNHIWWSAQNKPVEAEDLNIGDELFHMTENELRGLNNIGRKDLELRKKNSIRMKELNKTLDRTKLPQSQKGYKPKNPDLARKNKSEAAKKMWESEEYRRNWEEGMSKVDWNARPTSVEKKFIELFKENNIDVSYCGDSTLWINGCNPDFRVIGQKKLIEVYDSKMPKFMEDRSDDTWTIERKRIFEDAGYKCLFLNIREIDTALEKTQVFIHNGLKVINKEEVTPMKSKRLEKNEEGNIKVYDIKLKEGSNIFFVGRLASHNCGSAIANTSYTSELIKNMTLDDALKVDSKDIAKATGSKEIKLHCSMLAEEAIQAAIADVKQKKKCSKHAKKDTIPDTPSGC